jgi:ubiquinone/menaquinone biosynthesis C-methylase UbiE
MFTNPTNNLAQFNIRDGQTVADFGSGSGHYVYDAVARVGYSGHVYAIEIQKDLLLKLENELKDKKIENVTCIWGDIEKKGGTKIKDQSCDRVIVSNVFFQVGDKLGVIDEAKRILKKDGSILLLEWSDSFSGIGPQTDMVVKEDEAIKLFTMRGLKKESTISAGDHHYGIIFKINE